MYIPIAWRMARSVKLKGLVRQESWKIMRYTNCRHVGTLAAAKEFFRMELESYTPVYFQYIES